MIVKVKPHVAVFIIGEDIEDKKYISKHFTALDITEKMVNVSNNIKNCIYELEVDPAYYSNWRFETNYITDSECNIIKVILSVWNHDHEFTDRESQDLKKFARRGVRYYDI